MLTRSRQKAPIPLALFIEKTGSFLSEITAEHTVLFYFARHGENQDNGSSTDR